MFRGDRRIARMPWKVVKAGSVADGRDNLTRDNNAPTLGVVPLIQRLISSDHIWLSPDIVSSNCLLHAGSLSQEACSPLCSPQPRIGRAFTQADRIKPVTLTRQFDTHGRENSQ